MTKRHKAYAKLIRALLAAASAIYEMIFGEKPPKSKEVLR